MPDTRTAQRWDEEYRGGRYAAERPLPFVDTILEVVGRHGLAGDAIGLYVGCGNGRNYVPLVDAGLNLYGLDVSSEALRQLAARRPELAGRLVQGSFQDFRPPATLAGSVVQVDAGGNYAASTSYTILTADRGVHGTFDALSSNLAVLTPALAYNGNNVDLKVDLKQVPTGGDDGAPQGPDSGGGSPGTRPIRFADAAVTGNQRAVANALQSLGHGKRIQDAYAEAEQLYSTAFEIYASIDDKYSQRATLLSLAEVYLALGDQEKARSLADQAKELLASFPQMVQKGEHTRGYLDLSFPGL